MNELDTYQGNLPDKIPDLAKFIVLGQEKAKSLTAEIRAIQRLDMATEVYQQKKDELDALRRLMLDAYQRMGEFTRGGRKRRLADQRKLVAHALLISRKQKEKQLSVLV